MTLRDFDSIYREYQPKIQRYLRHLVGEGDAADLTQVVFLKVSRGLDRFREDASISTWIYRIATNAAHDHVTSLAVRQKEAERLLDEEAQVDDLPDADADGADQTVIRREMNSCIRGVVDQLPEGYRAVLLLSEFEGFTNPEIAGILDVSIEAVKIRLHRARGRLRRALEGECSFYRDERNELMCDRKAKLDEGGGG